jgi:hypothetical protein
MKAATILVGVMKIWRCFTSPPLPLLPQAAGVPGAAGGLPVAAATPTRAGMCSQWHVVGERNAGGIGDKRDVRGSEAPAGDEVRQARKPKIVGVRMRWKQVCGWVCHKSRFSCSDVALAILGQNLIPRHVFGVYYTCSYLLAIWFGPERPSTCAGLADLWANIRSVTGSKQGQSRCTQGHECAV